MKNSLYSENILARMAIEAIVKEAQLQPSHYNTILSDPKFYAEGLKKLFYEKKETFPVFEITGIAVAYLDYFIPYATLLSSLSPSDVATTIGVVPNKIVTYSEFCLRNQGYREQVKYKDKLPVLENAVNAFARSIKSSSEFKKVGVKRFRENLNTIFVYVRGEALYV